MHSLRIDYFLLGHVIKMKLMHYFSVIFVLLILQIGIKAEPPSLSINNLITNIIASEQFIRDSAINSNNEFDQTLPWINADFTLTANGSNCSRDIRILARDLAARKTWALKSKS